jgi:hypothetical protein
MAGVGRPTDYQEEYCQMLLDYFDTEPVSIKKDDDGNVLSSVVSEFPTLAGFARSINAWPQRLSEWGGKHPEFAEALKRAKCVQEHFLIVNGIMGRYDKTFAIFASKNIIGWKNEQETKLKIEMPIIKIVEKAKE